MKKNIMLFFMMLICTDAFASTKKLTNLIIENEAEEFFCADVTEIAKDIMTERHSGTTEENMLEKNAQNFSGHEKIVRDAMIKLAFKRKKRQSAPIDAKIFSENMRNSCRSNTNFAP